ncbi:hypothetical protein BC938DRAFT_481070 [Jimgerdemannia flammicorona]|uniref:F-box domain-containing protein n=1 Tax=Jimgerdemannia flammicorona TaxID=994334 RepID=A0A433QH16_9FUNG|nr:hypothetical protein BC938DRAFT_481070 [Jimgerdemannia flammicorona]
MTFPTLPCEILRSIFAFLPSMPIVDHHIKRSDLFNCSLVSCDWRAAALQKIWYKLYLEYIDDTGRDTVERFVASIVDSAGGAPQGYVHGFRLVRVLDFMVFEDTNRNVLGANHLVHRTSPVLRIMHLFSPGQIHEIWYYLPRRQQALLPDIMCSALVKNLRLFSINVFQVSADDGVLQRLPKELEVLHVNGYKVDPEEDTSDEVPSSLESIFLLPCLNCLVLREINSIQLSSFKKYLCNYGHNLRRLEIQYCLNLITESVIDHIIKCPNLAHLALFSTAKAPQRVCEDTLCEDTLCSLVGPSTPIRDLQLVQLNAVSNRFLAHCAAHGYNLHSLVVVDANDRITGDGILDVGAWRGMANLQILPATRNPVSDVTMNKGFVEAVRKVAGRMKICLVGNHRLNDTKRIGISQLRDDIGNEVD